MEGNNPLPEKPATGAQASSSGGELVALYAEALHVVDWWRRQLHRNFFFYSEAGTAGTSVPA
jgi:hypothetical protein